MRTQSVLLGGVLLGAAGASGVVGAASAPASDADAVVATIASLEIARSLGEGELFAALSHPKASVRRRAALALGRIQDRSATRHLVRALCDADPEVVREAAFALGQIGDPAACAGIDALARHADPEARALAAEALGRIGAKEPLVALLQDGEARVRGEAALGLWRAKASGAGAALAAALGDPDAGVRWRAAYALMQLEVEADALRRAASDVEPLARGFACRGLGKAPGPETEAVLAQRLSDPVWTVAVEAAKALARATDGSEPTARAIARAFSAPSFHVRREAALAAAAVLAKREDAALRARLRTLAREDVSAAVRAEALHALVRSDTEEAARALVDPQTLPREPWLRVRAADALGERKPDWAVPVLARLARDPDLQVREAALTALGNFLGSPRARAALLEAAEIRDLGLRGTAIEALGAWKRAELVPSFARWIEDSPGSELAEVRALALEAISKVEEKRRVARLEAALRDPDVIVRSRAASLLQGLTGYEYRCVPVLSVTPAPPPLAPAGRPRVRLRTAKGDVVMETFPEEAPVRVSRFLADVRSGFYDGLTIHRVVSNFVVQGGDPRGDGWGGGTGVPEEIGRRRFERGSVGTPTSGKDTGGSQLFVTHGPTPHLDGRYTIFAQVVEGMDVIDSLEPKDALAKAVIE